MVETIPEGKIEMEELRDQFLPEIWALFLGAIMGNEQKIMTTHYIEKAVDKTGVWKQMGIQPNRDLDDATKSNFKVATESHSEVKEDITAFFSQLLKLGVKTVYDWQRDQARLYAEKKPKTSSNPSPILSYFQLISQDPNDTLDTPAAHIIIKLEATLNIVYALLMLGKDHTAILDHPKTTSVLMQLLDLSNSQAVVKKGKTPSLKKDLVELQSDEAGPFLALAPGALELIKNQTSGAALNIVGKPANTNIPTPPPLNVEVLKLWKLILKIHAQQITPPAT